MAAGGSLEAEMDDMLRKTEERPKELASKQNADHTAGSVPAVSHTDDSEAAGPRRDESGVAGSSAGEPYAGEGVAPQRRRKPDRVRKSSITKPSDDAKVQDSAEITVMPELSLFMAPLLDATDKLRMMSSASGKDFAESDNLFPSIAVIGDQSSGKSSVLQATSGIKFPKGDGVVTRRPIQLQMRQDSKWKCTVSYKVGNDEVKYSFNDIESVAQTLVEAQRSVVTEQQVVSDEVVKIEVRSPDLPNLTLLDLPGINRDSRELEEATIQLIERFIRDSLVIILVVFQVNTDPATASSFRLARQFDPAGERTIGVMTHCDSLASGREQQVERLLKGETPSSMVVRNFFGVSCRSQDQKGRVWSHEEAIRQEAEFFESNDFFNQFPKTQLSSGALREALTSRVFKMLMPMRNEVLSKIWDRKAQRQQEIRELLGGACSTIGDSMNLSNRLIFDLVRDIGEHLTGSHRFERNPPYSKYMARWQVYSREILECKSALLNTLKTEMEAEYQDQQGRELPFLTNNFPVLERLVYSKLVLKCKPAVETMLNDVSMMVKDHLSELTVKQLSDYPRLQTHVFSKIEQIFSDCERRTKEKVLDELHCEKHLFSLTPEFLDSCRQNFSPQQQQKNEDEKERLSTDAKHGAVDIYSRAHVASQKGAEGSKDATQSRHELEEVDRLCRVGSDYITVVCNRLIDNLPRQVLKHMHHSIAEECKTILNLLSDPERIHELMKDPDKEWKVNNARKEEAEWTELERRLLTMKI